MKEITSYIDNLFDYFPINKTSSKMRMDLLEATQNDYESLINQEMDKKEASQMIINRIASPEQIATMIPNRHSLSFYFYWLISIAATYLIFYYISNPNFLQIFLPTVMEFPNIIEMYIHYFFIVLITYAACYSFYRLLPQKFLTRNEFQSATFLYLGTAMASLYFSVAIAFVWYTFNGYLPENITYDAISTFVYSFYTIFFSSDSMVALYAVANALCFVLSSHTYHLDFTSQPYYFEQMYQPLEVTAPIIVEQQEPVQTNKTSWMDKIKSLFKRKEKAQPIEEIQAPSIVILEEVISFIQETH